MRESGGKKLMLDRKDAEMAEFELFFYIPAGQQG